MLQNTNYNKEGYLIGMVDICYCLLSLCSIVMCCWEKMRYPNKQDSSVLLSICDYDEGKD